VDVIITRIEGMQHWHPHTHAPTHTHQHAPQCCPWQRWQGSWDPACSRRVSGAHTLALICLI